jgi:hypothetical protein
MCKPARSSTLVVIFALQPVAAGRGEFGVNVAFQVDVSYATVPFTGVTPHVKEKLLVFIEGAATSSLKAALTIVFTATPVALFAGVGEETVGAVASLPT